MINFTKFEFALCVLVALIACFTCVILARAVSMDVVYANYCKSIGMKFGAITTGYLSSKKICYKNSKLQVQEIEWAKDKED